MFYFKKSTKLAIQASKCNSYLKILFLFSILTPHIKCDLVVLNLRDELTSTEPKQICAIKKEVNRNDYNIKFSLLDVTPYNGCKAIKNDTFANKAIFMRNITITTAACQLGYVLKNLEDNQASLAIIGASGPIKTNLSNTNVSISPIFMPSTYADELNDFILKSTQPSVEVVTSKEKFDPSLIIIWLMAVISVLLGSIWASYEFKKSLKAKADEACSLNTDTTAVNMSSNQNKDEQQQQNDNNLLTNENPSNNNEAPNGGTNNATESNKKSNKNKNDDDGPLLSISYVGVLVLLIFVIAILLLLYFFFDYMIYFVYFIFSVGATMSMYRIVCLIFDKLNFAKCRIPQNNLPILKHRPQIAKIIIAFLLIGVSVTWFVFRNKSWGWAIQNVLALSLAINALSFYRLSSYKMVTIILILFFLYDVFMVFISPYITQGTSIMEAVAFGGRDKNKNTVKNEIDFNITETERNQLPVVIIIPRLSKFTRLCLYYLEYPYSLLGLGDMLIPGLSVNYAILFDIASRNRIKIYFIANVFAYAFGLFLAFIGLIFMETAQPALFYLCPAHLIITYLIAIIRKEVKLFWSGESIGKYSLSETTEDKRNFRTESLENIIETEQQQPQQQQQPISRANSNVQILNENFNKN